MTTDQTENKEQRLMIIIVLGIVLFNIFLADFFYVVKDIDIASDADDSTPL